MFIGVTDVTADGGAVVVRLGEGPEPALQRVGPQLVACHLHGIVVRDEDEASKNRPATVARP